jgi:hypothetical protein
MQQNIFSLRAQQLVLVGGEQRMKTPAKLAASSSRSSSMLYKSFKMTPSDEDTTEEELIYINLVRQSLEGSHILQVIF